MLFHNIIKKLVSDLSNSQRIRRTTSLSMEMCVRSQVTIPSQNHVNRQEAVRARSSQSPSQSPSQNQPVPTIWVVCFSFDYLQTSQRKFCLVSQRSSYLSFYCSVWLSSFPSQRKFVSVFSRTQSTSKSQDQSSCITFFSLQKFSCDYIWRWLWIS